MKKEGGGLLKIVAIFLTVIILTLVASSIILLTGKSVADITEKGVFEIKWGQITPEYIILGIQNRGAENYSIDEISIDNCGKNAGGEVIAGEGIKVFSILCGNPLEEDFQFRENATITYSILGKIDKDEIKKFVLSGEVLSKRCVYDIYQELTPIIINKCVNQTDCILQRFKVRDKANEERKTNNKSEINLENITALDCSYA
jgi:hypothetical protein